MNDLAVAHQRLEHQGISRQRFKQAEAVVRWLGAIQGQDYPGTKWSIGLRLPGSSEHQLEQAIVDRHILRSWVMRGTLHFAAAADLHWLVALIAPRTRAGNARRYQQLELDAHTLTRGNDVIVKTLQQAGQRLLTRHDLFEGLEASGIATTGQRGIYLLQHAALDRLICQGAMQGTDATFMLLPAGRTLPHDEASAELAKRYFTSRGPASLKDFTWWSGLAASDAKAGLEAVKSGLTEMKLNGQSLWYVDNLSAERSGELGCYLLPGFDEYLLGYQDRSAVLDPADARKVLPGGGIFAPAIVMNGRVIGTWKRTIKKRTVVITLDPFSPLTTPEHDAIVSAAGLYGKFLDMPVTLV